MKHLIFITLGIITLVGCSKDPAKKAFLTGRLIDQCDGNPVANHTLHFYRNFKESNSWLVSDTEERLLETTTTNAEGYFYFSGDEYTSNGTPSIPGSSIRLDDGTRIIEGSLGEGKNAENTSQSNKDLGDILLNGMSINLTISISNTNGAIVYDSVSVHTPAQTGVMLTTSSNGYFEIPEHAYQLRTQNFSAESYEDHDQFHCYLLLYFYVNGEMHTKEVPYYYFEACSANGSLIFDY